MHNHPRIRQVYRMKRRAFIAGLGGAAAWPVVTRAQQSDQLRRVAMLLAAKADDSEYPILVETFVQGLQKANWIEGSNLKLDIRWGGGSVDGIAKVCRGNKTRSNN